MVKQRKNKVSGRGRVRTGWRDRPLVVIVTRHYVDNTEQLEDNVVEALLAGAEERGWRLLDLDITRGSLSGESKPAAALVTALPDDPQVMRLRQMGVPVVRLGRLTHPDDAAAPAVLPDYGAAGRMAADYFIERGFRQLAMVGHAQMLQNQLMEAGFRQRAESMGCTCHELHFHTPTDRVRGGEDRAALQDRRVRELSKWLTDVPKPVGLLSADPVANVVSLVCTRTGLSVPEDVAVLSGSNRRATCEMSPVPISAIDLTRVHQAQAAMGVLDDVIAGKPVPARTMVPPRGIVTRRSTEIMAIEHPLVARAVRYIWDHLDKDLSVGDVAKGTGTPRYRLERLFRRYLERGVNGELRRARLERFRELLRTTDLTIEQLTPMVGYRSSKRLHGTFRDTFGMTPRKYRLQAAVAQNK